MIGTKTPRTSKILVLVLLVLVVAMSLPVSGQTPGSTDTKAFSSTQAVNKSIGPAVVDNSDTLKSIIVGFADFSWPLGAENSNSFKKGVLRVRALMDEPAYSGKPDSGQQLTIHTHPVKYFNGSGYVPIDPNVTEVEDGRYGVTKGPYSAYWNEKADLRVTDGEHFLTYREKGVNHGGKSRSPVLQGKPKLKGNRITYERFYPDVDLEYQYRPDLLKQNYVLQTPPPGKSRDEYMEFRGELTRSEGLEVWVEGEEAPARFTTNDSIEFRDGNETVFSIAPPVIRDSNHSATLGEYEYRRTGKKAQLVLKAPLDWLQDPERVYPVKIDPTIKSPIRNTFQPGEPILLKVSYRNTWGHSTSFRGKYEISDGSNTIQDGWIWANGDVGQNTLYLRGWSTGGQTGTWERTIRAPETPGEYNIEYEVQFYAYWFNLGWVPDTTLQRITVESNRPDLEISPEDITFRRVG